MAILEFKTGLTQVCPYIQVFLMSVNNYFVILLKVTF